MNALAALAVPDRRDLELVRHADALTSRRRFENMLDRHESRLRRLAFGMLGDPHRVDDVLQDALVRAYVKLPARFANEQAEAAWIYRIVHRTCLNELRTRRRRREDELDVDDARFVTREVDPRSLEIAEALARLTPAGRSVVLLVDLVGFDYETAASILRVRRGTVASRLNSARAALREMLDA